jgi:hypothetical protein
MSGPAVSTARPAATRRAALATSLDDVAPFDYVRPVAAALIDQAIPPTAAPETANV